MSRSVIGKEKPERPRHGWRNNIKIDFIEKNGNVESGFIWLRTETCDRIL
jgi:hypothetical protein